MTMTNPVGVLPGLLEGRVAGAFNITSPNPGQVGAVGGPKLEPIRAQVVGNTNAEPFPDNTTYIYSGQMFFPDDLSEHIFTTVAPYNDRSGRRDVLNRDDRIARDAGPLAQAAVREREVAYEAFLIVGVAGT